MAHAQAVIPACAPPPIEEQIDLTAPQRDRNKKALLAAGAKYFFSRIDGVDPFRSLKMTDLANAVGNARQTFYGYWRNKKLFIRDLTLYLLGDPSLFEKEFREIEGVAQSAVGSPLDTLCAVASKDVETLLDNDVWRAMEVLAVGFMPQKPEFHPAATAGYRAVDVETYQLYNIVLSRLGRRPREPFTEASVGKALQALAEGSGIRQIFEREAFSQPVNRESGIHGCYAYAVVALLAVLTANEADRRTLDQLLAELLSMRHTVQTTGKASS